MHGVRSSLRSIKAKESTMKNLLVETIIPLAGAYAFGLIGCRIAEERDFERIEFVSLLMCGLLSHGGGLTRDLLSNLVNHMFVVPSALCSWDSWMAAGIGFATYLMLKHLGRYDILERHDVKLALAVLDGLAVPNYTFIGASRLVHVFGNTSAPVVALYAACTGLGGGLWSLFVYRPDKADKIKGNAVYYITSFLSACIATRLTLMRYPQIEEISLILSLLGAFVAIVSDCLANSPQHSWMPHRADSARHIHHEPTINLKLSFGAFFQLIRNPYKGVHLHLTAPLHFGSVLIDVLS